MITIIFKFLLVNAAGTMRNKVEKLTQKKRPKCNEADCDVVIHVDKIEITLSSFANTNGCEPKRKAKCCPVICS